MQSRCGNPNAYSFRHYGAKGISVCDEWKAFEAFAKWAFSVGWSKGLEIDRINNNKGYSPENCRVVTRLENARNRPDIRHLTMGGQTMPVWRWADLLGLRKGTILQRLHRGDTDEQALRPMRAR
jgi:hypothetical protein